jgi:hypothetical protein
MYLIYPDNYTEAIFQKSQDDIAGYPVYPYNCIEAFFPKKSLDNKAEYAMYPYNNEAILTDKINVHITEIAASTRFTVFTPFMLCTGVDTSLLVRLKTGSPRKYFGYTW